jgi:SAM-dependent methyltransferase
VPPSDPYAFATDLYRGTAEFYDRFRPPYPPALIDDLVDRVRPSPGAHLLDLACGPGTLAFALAPYFGLVLAVDQEPDMVRFVAGRSAKVRAVVSAAENLVVDPGSLELITIGNAFHRLRREQVGRLAHGWLAPGGHLAVCWSGAPWNGDDDWREALRDVLTRWRRELGTEDRVPPNWEDARRARPDQVVLAGVGFAPLGTHEFRVSHTWTPASLAGFIFSTSFLARPVFGDRAAEFEADLAHELPPHFLDEISFACDLYARPPGADQERGSCR